MSKTQDESEYGVFLETFIYIVCVCVYKYIQSEEAKYRIIFLKN